jgi:hypothetical protein
MSAARRFHATIEAAILPDYHPLSCRITLGRGAFPVRYAPFVYAPFTAITYPMPWSRIQEYAKGQTAQIAAMNG